MISNENGSGVMDVLEVIGEYDLPALIENAPTVYKHLQTDTERAQAEQLFIARAMLLGNTELTAVRNVFTAMKKDMQKRENSRKKQLALDAAEDTYETFLERDKKGDILPSLNNYQTIMHFDSFYKDIHYNVLKSAPEIHQNDFGKLTIKPWTDADDVASLSYIEGKFHIYSDQKHSKALTSLFSEREYNPVLDIVERIEWDGQERIGSFLCKWMKAEDTPYVREVSRLIFAGGINRLYAPGCKFDDVPVLIGTNQGEGKSTVVRWLAIHDDYASEVTDFDGQEAVEQLEGAWICEVAELLALTKTKEQEAVKAFITRQTDKYRKPYAKNASVIPRRCVFIGTTNNQQFLRDKTGNRRFYPVEVHNSGYELFDHEEECREDILQCWAEAREKYKAGKMPGYADRHLLAEYKEAQENAMEDDWRIGAVRSYLEQFYVGDKVCARQIAREAFKIGDEYSKDPDKKESTDITSIMSKMPGWKRYKGALDFNGYGKQRGWEKVDGEEPREGLPF